jgi:hypothetical protein
VGVTLAKAPIRGAFARAMPELPKRKSKILIPHILLNVRIYICLTIGDRKV